MTNRLADALQWLRGHERGRTFETANGKPLEMRLWRIGRLCTIYHPKEQVLRNIGSCSIHWYWKDMGALSGFLFSLRGSTLRTQWHHGLASPER